MAKGASMKFRSYRETVPKLLDILKLERELKKYDKIILKPHVSDSVENSTPREFLEEVLKFCIAHKNPISEVYIADGADGVSTEELFAKLGYKTLSEKYGAGLLDLNEAETKEIFSDNFLKFSVIHYPEILLESFVISLPKLAEDEEAGVVASLPIMLGAFPSSHYAGFFSRRKNKIRKWPSKYLIHDIAQCKLPDFAVVDASHQGFILAGLPFEIDKQASKLLGKDWADVPYLKLLEQTKGVEAHSS